MMFENAPISLPILCCGYYRETLGMEMVQVYKYRTAPINSFPAPFWTGVALLHFTKHHPSTETRNRHERVYPSETDQPLL